MRTSLLRLGAKFGNLTKISGTTKYHLSPFEQRAFAGALTKGLPNVLWRTRQNIFYWLPPTVIAYLIYTSVEAEHDRLQRKQPGEFDDDQ